MIYFSAVTIGFYDDNLKDAYDNAGTWPADAVELSAAEIAEYHMQQHPDGKQLGSVDGRPSWVDLPPPTVDEQRAKLQATRQASLQAILHDFGDGRVLQVRPQDVGNINMAIGIGVDTEWVMQDNSVALVTVADLQAALDSGIAQGKSIWDQYMTNLKAL